MNKLLGRLVLVCMGLLGGLVLSDLLVQRVFDPYACHDRWGWSFAPGKTAWRLSRSREFSHLVRTNSLGLHDAERSFEKPAGTYRILLLGDSMTAATHVPFEDSFGVVLERLLDDAAAPGARFEVINAGVDGFGTAQEMLLFEDVGYRFQPDLVLAGIFLGNDLADNSVHSGTSNHYLAGRCGRPYFELRGGELEPLDGGAPFRPPARWIDRLLERSTIYSNLFPYPTPPPDFMQWDIFDRERSAAVMQAWELTQRLLIALDQQVTDRGIPLVFVVDPDKRGAGQKRGDGTAKGLDERDYAGAYAMLDAFLDAQGLPYIDLLPALRKQVESGGPKPYYLINSHWNALGNSVAADGIFDWLRHHCGRLGLPLADCST
jgi:SGNH hydrolase-like domain, acetyltransferase AlgX